MIPGIIAENYCGELFEKVVLLSKTISGCFWRYMEVGSFVYTYGKQLKFECSLMISHTSL